MRVMINPARRGPDGGPVTVVNPRTGESVPTTPFDLTAEDLRHIGVRRLLPRSLGGRHGDLIPAPPTTTAPTTARQGD
jgi:hypothetical protein